MDTPIRNRVLERHAGHRDPCLAMEVALEAEKEKAELKEEIADHLRYIKQLERSISGDE